MCFTYIIRHSQPEFGNPSNKTLRTLCVWNQAALINSFKNWFGNRATSLDFEQAVLRVLVTCILVGYLYVAGVFQDDMSVILAMAYPMAAIVVLVWVLMGPDVSRTRRFIGMTSDIAGATYILAMFGEVGAPALFIYFWVTIGNGFRWGLLYLYVAMCLSIVGMLVVFGFSAYWRAIPYVYCGVTLSLLIVPLFVSRLLKRLNELIKKEQIANRYKTQFLANMSHELRTPLHGVIGTTDLLFATKLDRRQAEHVRAINASADALLAVVNDVLDISKIEAGKYQLRNEVFNLPSIVGGTIQVVKHELEQKGLTFALYVRSDIPVTVKSDPSAVRQVLLNLLSNAVKFTDHGRVTLSIGRSTDSFNAIKFEVADTGIGISPALQYKVFELFTQADDSVTREFGGTGLGMAISKHLADMLGGDIGLESVRGQGSRFWFTMTTDFAMGQEDNSETLKRSQILIVGRSDENPLVDEIRQVVSNWSHQALVANDKKEALNKVTKAYQESSPFDVIVVVGRSAGLDPQMFPRELTSNIDSQCRSSLIYADIQVEERALDDAGYITILAGPLNKEALHRALCWSVLSNSVQYENLASDRSRNGSPAYHTGAKILVADDQKSNRSILGNFLEYGGYSVTVVGDGEQALHILMTEQFDAAIIDYHMPGQSGVSLVKLFHAAYPEKDIPFLILTADATLRAKKECEAVGAIYISKPVRGNVLLKTLDSALLRNQEPDRGPVLENAVAVMDLGRIKELETYCRNTDAIDSTFKEFMDDARDRLRKMREVFWSGESHLIQEHAHAIKGSAEFIGAQRVAQKCSELQKLDISALAEQGEDHLHIVENELQAFSARYNALCLEREGG